MAQNIQDIPSPIPDPIPMDQDFQSPIVEEDVIPSEGAQASRSSFETPELDISKGKSKLSESEIVDVVLLQNRVFDLEQSSAEKDLIIGKQDIRISELEKENSNKDSKIYELQENLGGLTALLFDLKQHIFQKFGDEFQPLSAEGEKITASSSGPADPASQSSSVRATRPAPDANVDAFLSFGPSSAQERREKQIRIEQLKGKILVMKHSDQNALGGRRNYATIRRKLDTEGSYNLRVCICDNRGNTNWNQRSIRCSDWMQRSEASGKGRIDCDLRMYGGNDFWQNRSIKL
ncbi:unnamed protein product [Lactuca virosa]|uniref:Uncharacterized protein n=1 Tax=Lactuca virosa TaxID=75947 RepID=A0AAU9PSA7_9ASTR|nr:unnamed protein product [Lactuca virosa]